MSFPRLSILFLSVTLLFAATSARADSYVVTIDASTPRVARVHATIEPAGMQIGMNDEGNQGLDKGWATFVEDLVVRSGEGVVLPVSALPDSQWRIEGHNTGPVNLSYTVALEHDQVSLNFGDNGAAYANSYGVMWSGRALFIAGKPARNISVRFELPVNWKVSTPWALRDDGDNTYGVLQTQDLVNSGFFAGTHREFDLTAGQVTLRLALSGSNTLNMQERIARLTGRYLQYYESVYQSDVAASMLLIASDSSYWGGEVMGRAISISVGPEAPEGFDPLTALSHVIAHEIFHVFTGVRMEIANDSGELDWFNEGFGAEYAAWLARLRLGELTEEDFLAELVSQMGDYQEAVDGQTSLVQAGLDKANHMELVYSGGLMAAMTLDFMVRSGSNGAYSLDELWRTLLHRYPRGGESLSLTKLMSTVDELFGENAAVALDTWVNAPTAVPFFDYAEHMGLVYKNGELFFSPEAADFQKALWMKFGSSGGFKR